MPESKLSYLGKTESFSRAHLRAAGATFSPPSGLALLLAGILLLCPPAEAHPYLQNALWILIEETRLRVAVNVSIKEIQVVRGVDAAAALPAEGDLPKLAEAHAPYLLQHLRFLAGGRVLVGKVLKITPPTVLADAETSSCQYEIEYPLASSEAPLVTIEQTMLSEFEYGPKQRWEPSYLARIKKGNGAEVWSSVVPLGSAVPLIPPATDETVVKTRTGGGE